MPDNNTFDRVAKFYDNFLIQSFYSLAHKQNTKALSKFLENECRNVLDVGCGTGNFLNRIKKFNEKLELVGIDQSDKMIKLAKNKFKNINFLTAGADKIPFNNNHFDLITIVDSFYYFQDKKKIISECQRVLKKDGHLFIYTPSCDGLVANVLIMLTKCSPTEWGSKHLSFSDIKEISEKHGFNIVTKNLSFFPFTPLKYWSLFLRKI